MGGIRLGAGGCDPISNNPSWTPETREALLLRGAGGTSGGGGCASALQHSANPFCNTAH